MKRLILSVLPIVLICSLLASCSLSLSGGTTASTTASTTAAPATTAGPATASAPASATKAPETTAEPATTSAPATTAVPASTSAPATTAAPDPAVTATTATEPAQTEPPATTAAPATTGSPATAAPEPIPAEEEDLIEVNGLFHDLFSQLTLAETSVVYDDPSIGEALHASSSLLFEEGVWVYRATVDRLNPADAEEFATAEPLDPVSGTVEEIRQNYTGLFLWDRVATGLVLSTPAFSQDRVSSPAIVVSDGETMLTASVPDDQLENLFGIALSGVSGMTVEILYTETAVHSMTLTYGAGGATVTVTVVYAC